MISKYMAPFFATNWGDIVTVIGFVITIWTLERTRTAAVAARNAAEATTSQVLRIDTIVEFSAAIEISVQKLNPDLDTAQRSILGGALVQFRGIEEKVERAGASNRHLDPAKLNTLVSKVQDEVRAVLLSIRQAGI